jgi:hypothetical protein
MYLGWGGDELTPEESTAIAEFLRLRGRFTKARGTNKLALYGRMDTVLEGLGLDQGQRARCIAGVGRDGLNVDCY